jgi:hypothetical protein
VERKLLGILFPNLGHDAEESRDLHGQRSSHVWNVSSHVTSSNSASRFEPPPTSWATLERSLSALNQGDISPESRALINSIIDPSANLPSYPVEEVRMLVILHRLNVHWWTPNRLTPRPLSSPRLDGTPLSIVFLNI